MGGGGGGRARGGGGGGPPAAGGVGAAAAATGVGAAGVTGPRFADGSAAAATGRGAVVDLARLVSTFLGVAAAEPEAGAGAEAGAGTGAGASPPSTLARRAASLAWSAAASEDPTPATVGPPTPGDRGWLAGEPGERGDAGAPSDGVGDAASDSIFARRAAILACISPAMPPDMDALLGRPPSAASSFTVVVATGAGLGGGGAAFSSSSLGRSHVVSFVSSFQ